MSWFEDSARQHVGQFGPGSDLEPGMTWLLSVDPVGDGLRAALWRLEPGQADGIAHVGFRGRARRALDVGEALARLEVPLLGDPSSLASPSHWRARRLLQRGKGADQVLDGPSFGLAMVLAAVSRLVGLSLPTNVVACAEVTEAGRIEEVGCLDQKLALLAAPELAGRVRDLQILVAPDQRELAERHAPPGAVVHAAEGLAHAVELVFGPEALADRLVERWHDDGSRAEAAASLFRLALEGSGRLLRWGAVARASRWLLDDAGDADWRWKADLAWRIAARHAGSPEPITLDRAQVASMHRPRRLTLLAHELQAAADAVGPQWEPLLSFALATVAPLREEHPADLILLGSIGRVQAAWGRYEEAEQSLRRAVRGWLALDREPEISFALSELLRVLGIQGLGLDAETEAAVLRFRRDLRADVGSRAFVSVARGRALVQLGRTTDALDELGDGGVTGWAHTLPHLRAARERWLAVAVHGVDPIRARAAWDDLDDLAASQPVDAKFAADLARLDRVALGAEPRADLEAGLKAILDQHQSGPDARRILGFLAAGDAPPVEQASALRAHWRY